MTSTIPHCNDVLIGILNVIMKYLFWGNFSFMIGLVYLNLAQISNNKGINSPDIFFILNRKWIRSGF